VIKTEEQYKKILAKQQDLIEALQAIISGRDFVPPLQFSEKVDEIGKQINHNKELLKQWNSKAQ
jgi:mevalonate kinase